MEFLLGRECGDIMVQQHQDPVNKHTKLPAGARPLNDVKTIRPTYEEILKGIPEVKDQFRDTFGV
jgi:iron(III) transport system substrate-binding protein